MALSFNVLYRGFTLEMLTSSCDVSILDRLT